MLWISSRSCRGGTSSLSGGERQRVALGRTLLAQPRLLLLDEPMSALDASRKMEILPYLEALHPRFGIPTLYVSHSVDEVALLADRIVVLAGGRVTAKGRTAEILERLDLGPLADRRGAATVVEARVRETRPRVSPHVARSGGSDPGGAETRALRRGRGGVRGHPGAGRLAGDPPPAGREHPERPRGRVCEVTEREGSAFAEVSVDLGRHRLLARITRLSLHDLELAVGSPVFALLKSVSLSKQRA